MKLNKGYIIFFTVIALYIIIVFILFGWNNILKKWHKSYIIIEPNTKWKYLDGKWSDIGINEHKLYNWQTFKIYSDHEYFGDYQLLYNDKWYIFDKNRQSQKITGNLFAYRGNVPISVIDFNRQELTAEDELIINDVFKTHKLSANMFSLKEKIEIDVDNDGKNEVIYAVSNILTGETYDENIFSLIFMKKNNKISIIYKSTGIAENTLNYCVARIQYIIDIGNNKKYELITSCPYFSQIGNCNSLYELSRKQYKAVKTCQGG